VVEPLAGSAAGDLLALQADDGVASTLGGRNFFVMRAIAPPRAAPPEARAAYDLYALGYAAYLNWTADGFAESKRFFDAAVAKDARLTLAHVQRGWRPGENARTSQRDRGGKIRGFTVRFKVLRPVTDRRAAGNALSEWLATGTVSSAGFCTASRTAAPGQFASHGVDPPISCDPQPPLWLHHHAHYRLPAGMDANVLHCHLLLALATVAVERFEQCGKGARKLVGLGEVLTPPFEDLLRALPAGGSPLQRYGPR
jgi:hypothetical protein